MLTQGSMIHRDPDRFSITEIREKAYGNTFDKVLDYDVSKGLDPDQLAKLYKENLKRLQKMGLSSRFGSYREHLLVYAARQTPGL